MALNTVTLKWDLTDLIQAGVAATLSITPTAQLSDTTDHILIPPVARTYTFTGGTGQLAGIVANDNPSILPAGSGYLISVTSAAGHVLVPQFQTQLLYANGATQWLDALAVVPSVTTSYQYLPLPSGTPTSGQVPVATGSGEASKWGNFVGLAPAGTQAGGGDAANINGLINLGGKAVLQAGQFWLEAPIVPPQDKYTQIEGAGNGLTILSPANGANCDVIKGAGFATLTNTGTGTATAAGPFLQLSNLTIDGNRSNQTLSALTNASCNPATPPPNGYGIRLYGRSWNLANVDVRNCFAYGIWTEWGIPSSGTVYSSGSLEGYAVNIKVYDNGAHGWYHRGPSDCELVGVVCWSNNQAALNAGLNFWAEADNVTNGSGTNHFTPNGLQLANSHFWDTTVKWGLVLDCDASVANSHAEGAATGQVLIRGSVKWSGGEIYYIPSQVSAWGCGVQFGDTGSTTGVPTSVSVGVSVDFAGLLSGFLCDTASRAGIVWANANQSAVDAKIITKAVPAGAVGAGSNGQTLPQSSIAFTGGTSLPPNGVVSIADSGGPDTVTYTGNTGSSLTGCTGGTHTLATGNTITLKNVGTVAIAGVVDTGSMVAIELDGSGLASGVTQAASLHYAHGRHVIDVGAGNQAYLVTNNGTDAFNINTNGLSVSFPNGYDFRLYSDAYTTKTVDFNGAAGHIGTGVPSGSTLAIAAAAGAGSSPPAPTLQSLASDTQGSANLGTGTSPTSGSQATITYGTAFNATPVVVLSAVNAATAALLPYVSTASSSGFNIAFANAPAASQATGTYGVNYHVLARGS